VSSVRYRRRAGLVVVPPSEFDVGVMVRFQFVRQSSGFVMEKYYKSWVGVGNHLLHGELLFRQPDMYRRHV